MIFYLLFFYLLSESMATNSTNDSITDTNDMSKSIICYYSGQLSKFDPNYDDLDPKDIPKKCGFIQFRLFSINQSSMIYVNQELLDEVIALKKPIILKLAREETYTGWTAILGSEGNEHDAKVLCDFATNNSIKGYTIFGINPDDNEAINENIGKYIIPYLKQLKELCPSNFIIGLGISVVPKILKNTKIYDFEELNNLVTFYDINTLELNTCNPKLYNGLTPITKSNPGENYLYGLEEVVSNLKETKICFKKLVFVIPLFTVNNYTIDEGYPSYTKMCEGKVDNSSWCIQTSQNYYDKGKYFHDLPAGIKVSGLDWDDYGNTCKCQSAFNGFYNIYAGYTSGTVIPCAKFDVQSIIYPIK